jgi:hypothetical protein
LHQLDLIFGSGYPQSGEFAQRQETCTRSFGHSGKYGQDGADPMNNRVVDILVEAEGSAYFVVLKADGHEIERARFNTQEEAIRVAQVLSEKAERGLANVRSSAGDGS